jgi:hypothetical protein
MLINLGWVNISFKEMKAYMQQISVTLKESALLYNKVFAYNEFKCIIVVNRSLP